MSLVQIKNLNIYFDTRPVVENLNLTIQAGEKFALVGESGSGKTVTALSIARLNQDATYHGEITFLDKLIFDLSLNELSQIRGRDIAMIFQEPMTALNPLFTIGNQIQEVLTLHFGMSQKVAQAKVLELLERTGLPDPRRIANAYPHQLSGGQRQRAMIAMALASEPKLLIADEPTTALDVTIRLQIVELLNTLQKEENMAVLLITHDLNLVKNFADRVGVMEKGKLVEVAETKILFSQPKESYTQKLLNSVPHRYVDDVERVAHLEPLLDMREVSCFYSIKKGWFKTEQFAAAKKVNMCLGVGETVGVVGESGSGKSTLGMAALRLSDAKVDGQIIFQGQMINAMSQSRLRGLRSQMQVVFQDPYGSLSPRLTIQELMEEGLKLHFASFTQQERLNEIIQCLEEVGLSADILSRYPHEFSGGQRQRIAIARVLVLKPALIVLDEPTSALDVTVQAQVLTLLAQLQKKYQIAYLLISHDLAVIRAMAHRVMVMQHGEILEEGEVNEVLFSPKHPYTQRLLHASQYGDI
jgi:microcin C transport system ATP-binding protein